VYIIYIGYDTRATVKRARLLTKANEELNEPLDNKQRLRLIDQLLETYKEKYPQQQLSAAEEKDEFLLRFLRAKKFDIDRAVLMMNNYVTRRQIFPEVFDKIDHPQLISDILDTKYITVLEGSAKNGSALILLRPCFGCEDPPIFSIFAGAFLTIERLLEKEENQVHGVTLIEDVNYVNMNLVKQLGPVIGRKFSSIVQDTLPMRLKNICFRREQLSKHSTSRA
jgi:hypothetical protein